MSSQQSAQPQGGEEQVGVWSSANEPRPAPDRHLPILWSPAAQAATSEHYVERISKSSLGAQTRDTRPLGGKKGRNQT